MGTRGAHSSAARSPYHNNAPALSEGFGERSGQGPDQGQQTSDGKAGTSTGQHRRFPLPAPSQKRAVEARRNRRPLADRWTSLETPTPPMSRLPLTSKSQPLISSLSGWRVFTAAKCVHDQRVLKSSYRRPGRLCSARKP